jgi:hypothetical protein
MGISKTVLIASASATAGCQPLGTGDVGAVNQDRRRRSPDRLGEVSQA